MYNIGIVEANFYRRQMFVEAIGSLSRFNLLFHESDLNIHQPPSRMDAADVIVWGFDLSAASQFLKYWPLFKERNTTTRVLTVLHDPCSALVTQLVQAGVHGIVTQDGNIHNLMAALHGLYEEGCFLCSKSFKFLRLGIEDPIPARQQFSKKERLVLTVIKTGAPVKQIAQTLGISVAAVNFHLQNIYRKLQINSRSELMSYFAKQSNFDSSAKIQLLS